MTQTQSKTPLNADQLRQWDEDGYLLLRQIMPPAIVQGCRDMFERVSTKLLEQLKAEGLIDDTRPDLPLETRFAQAAGKHAGKFGRGWRKAVVSREVYDLHRVDAVLDVVQQLTGTDVIGSPIFNARPKLPNQQLTVVPWHQDSSYFGEDTARSLIITAWVPFVPVDEANGCLQVERGSHKRGLLQHRVETAEGQFLELPPEIVDQSKVVTLPMQPGDVLLFNNLVNHRSLPGGSPPIRWSIDVRYNRDGDPVGGAGWGEPGVQWVIRSDNKPVTTFEQWLKMTDSFGW